MAIASGCTLRPDGNGAFGTGATSASAGQSDDESGDGSESNDESEAGSDGGSTGVDPSLPQPTSTGEVEGESSSGAGGSTTSAGQEGPACGQAGDVVASGSIGPANADQYCPTTAYTAVVAGGGMVGDLEVLLDATVATSSEFTATLRSPSGTEVVLFDRHGGPFSDDFIDTYFDDASPSPVSSAAAPRSGCFAPDQPLSAFAGEPAAGTWTLTVQTCLYAVSVDAWELRITN